MMTRAVALASLPRSIKVGPHIVRIKTVDDGVMGDGGRHGQCSQNRLLIAVDSELPPTLLGETVLHEAAHVLTDGLGLPDGNEELIERLCLRFGIDMLAFIRDNPELIKWIQNL